MGDRISVSFYNEDEGESVVLFSHWGGKNFLNDALKYLKNLKEKLEKRKNKISDPISRLEPNTVMVDFIRNITKEEDLIEGNLYLGKDENDGDNSDNGHWCLDVDTGDIV
jgi:hypothetical protein